MKAMSCHVCGMWIEIDAGCVIGVIKYRSCHVCGMWIEIVISFPIFFSFGCHATYVACGLKSREVIEKILCMDVMPRMWHVD